jgi:phenylalanyl-tRNA synthetase beta chain
MRVLWSWLKELVELEQSPDEAAELLNIAGIEVDEIERSGPQFSGVITARIEEVSRHPNADKLSMCRVFDGTEERTVVCGATNMKAGDGVAMAVHKARLPGGVVKRGKIRGERSDGMLCSEVELEIGDDSDGILILPGDQRLGVPLQQALGLDDCVLVLDLTPDRADCLGMVGVARELAALTGAKLKGAAKLGAWWEEVAPGPSFTTAGAGEMSVPITIEDADGCPRYTGLVVRGVEIGPSPAWMTQRLKSVGAGVHNNVVDATNYLCRLLGQPFHAFDLKFLRGQQIVVRRASEGEPFKALDGVEHVLSAADVAICDAEGPVALGGVIGGEGSMVADDTTDLLLEAAWFEPTFIRATMARLGAKTESGDRFARGVDPRGTAAANRMLAELIVEIAGGEVVGKVADCNPRPWKPGWIRLETRRLNALLGTDLDTATAASLLKQDGMLVEMDGDGVRAQWPPWRFDMEQDVDLVEEVARIHGYDAIPITLPVAPREPVTRSDTLEQDARRWMVGQGFDELQLLTFCGEDELRDFGLTDEEVASTVRLTNPLGADSALLQPTLLPAMVRHAGAASRRTTDLRTFQLRRTFRLGGGDTGVHETVALAALWMGTRTPRSWSGEVQDVDFFDLKGVLEGLLQHFRVGGIRYERPAELPAYLDPGQCAVLTRGKDRCGVLGRLAPALVARHDLAGPAYAFELSFGDLVRKAPKLRYKIPSEYPTAQRDVAVVVERRVAAEDLIAAVRKAKPAHLISADVFDVYEGDELGADRRSVAIRMVFQSDKGTLSGDVVDGAFSRVLDRLRLVSGVTVREA